VCLRGSGGLSHLSPVYDELSAVNDGRVWFEALMASEVKGLGKGSPGEVEGAGCLNISGLNLSIRSKNEPPSLGC
jgi:hypothetical protein